MDSWPCGGRGAHTPGFTRFVLVALSHLTTNVNGLVLLGTSRLSPRTESAITYLARDTPGLVRAIPKKRS